MSTSVNPYQAPDLEPDDEFDLDITVRGEFVVRPSDVRDAERYYIIYHHQLRLIIGCTLLVLATGWVLLRIAVSNPTMVWMIIATMGSMVISAGIYLALVHHTKINTRKRMKECGFDQQQHCQLVSTPDTFSITVGENAVTWPNEEIQSHAYSDGLLFCAEPFLFYTVPSSIELDNIDFRHLAKIAKQRYRHR